MAHMKHIKLTIDLSVEDHIDLSWLNHVTYLEFGPSGSHNGYAIGYAIPDDEVLEEDHPNPPGARIVDADARPV